MDALLRELHQGPDGIPEYRDTELAGGELTIGSAPDQRIQLLGREVAPEHAVLRGAAGRLELSCRRGRRVRVNDKVCASARLALGDVIEIAGHRLTVAAPPGGFDAALELEANPEIDASEFESAFRTDLGQTALSKRAAAWLLVALIIVLGLALPLFAVKLDRAGQNVPAWLPSDALWSSGPLHPAHQQATAGECASCHEQLFVHVGAAACQSCHRTTHDHVAGERLALTQLGATPRCASCHREHNEPASYLVDRGEGLCIDCHGDSTAFGALERAPVTGFSARHHPAFRPHLLRALASTAAGAAPEWRAEAVAMDGAREQSNLKFSHRQHLDPDRVLRSADSAPLGCADCHRLEPDGEHFEPITMQGRCAACHELTFDPAAPDRQLPHGKPREVVLALEDYFTRKFTDPEARAPTRERRRLPGHEDAAPACSGAPFDCAMRAARAEIENQFARRGCVGCHVVTETQAARDLERFQVQPIRLARDYFPAGRFDHRSHQVQGRLRGDAACLSCHAARESTASADVLLPALSRCEGCHGDEAARERVSMQCVSCHAYHPAAATVPPRVTEAAAAHGLPLRTRIVPVNNEKKTS